jgi:argininosuccinate lyase
LQQLQEIDARFEEDVLKVWNYEESVERKSSIGGTAKSRVLEQIDQCVAFAQLLSNA